MKRLELALLLNSVLHTVKCTSEVCTNTVEGVYRVESRCTGAHISSALSAGEGCAPRATLLRLPWPNSTQIDQVRYKSHFFYVLGRKILILNYWSRETFCTRAELFNAK